MVPVFGAEFSAWSVVIAETIDVSVEGKMTVVVLVRRGLVDSVCVARVGISVAIMSRSCASPSELIRRASSTARSLGDFPSR